MIEPLFFTPVFQDRVWGGQKLRTDFHYNIESNSVGECWAISAHPNGQSVVSNGVHKGKALGELWKANRELFGDIEGEKFPLLVKILDANHDLSVQVHPNDAYASNHANGELGKTECWYIIDCDEKAELVFGHHAQSKEELVSMIDQGNWNQFLQRIPIKKGDFFYVPSGTVHALCKGTLVLETQQNSDTTYRLYDYNRISNDGKKRELHLKQSKDVITIPHQNYQVEAEITEGKNYMVTTFVRSPYFTVEKWEISGHASFEHIYPFLLCSVIEGNGLLKLNNQSFHLQKGDHFLLPAANDIFQLEGGLDLMVSYL